MSCKVEYFPQEKEFTVPKSNFYNHEDRLTRYTTNALKDNRKDSNLYRMSLHTLSIDRRTQC